MNFLVRSVKTEDLSKLHELARQFALLNLPPDKKLIADLVERSQASFAAKIPQAERKYLFVIEDLESQSVAGSSQVKAKHGTPKIPTYSFKILKKERFSKDLGVGFIHSILRLNVNTDGPTEIGGLVVDRSYRRRPERVGKVVSLSRFTYIGMYPERFEPTLLAEMAPPLTEEGRSEFWEALGRRFTGMPYQEADALSHQNKEFIKSLFPEEDIYLCLLDSKARLTIGRVGEETQAALHLLEKIGFQFTDEVDPFDGGPHLSCPTSEVSLIRNGKRLKVKRKTNTSFDTTMTIVGVDREDQFCAGASAFYIEGDEIVLPELTIQSMKLDEGEEVFATPMP